jgi:hypothetical protein
MANVEEHAFRSHAHHVPRRQIDNEQGLPAFDLVRVLSLLFEPGENRPPMIAEVDCQADESSRLRNVLDRDDGPDANVELLEYGDVHERFHRSGREVGHGG